MVDQLTDNKTVAADTKAVADSKTAAAAADTKAAADNRSRKDAASKKTHDDFRKDRADQAKSNEEVMAREAKYRPTPSIDEIQAAMAGVNVDQKVPDGSPEQNIHHRTVPIQTQIEVGRTFPEVKSASVDTKTSDPAPVSDKGTYTTRAASPVKPMSTT